jgi:hypothetical protein
MSQAKEVVMKKALVLCFMMAVIFMGCDELAKLLETPTTDTDSGGTGGGGGGGGTTATTGTLQIVADSYAYIYVDGGYVGKGSAYLTLSPGSYTVSAYAPSTSKKCWESKTTVYAGKNSVVKNNSYCR